MFMWHFLLLIDPAGKILYSHNWLKTELNGAKYM